MPINKLIIKNYKSLKDVSLEMKSFMVFIGPNNAGKSNILDCLSFLSEFGRRGDEIGGVIRRGGFEQIVHNGIISNPITFELEGSLKIKGEEIVYKYYIELIGERFGGFRNNKELFVVEGVEKPLLEFPGEQNLAIVRDKTGKQTGKIGRGYSYLYIPYFDDINQYPILGTFANEMQNWTFLNLLPPLMREPLPVRKELQLQTWGENLSVVLHDLQVENPPKFKEIEQILKLAVPELEELTTGLTSHDPGKTFIRITEKNLKMSIPAWNMSDGSLRLLGVLAALYLPSPLPLIGIEEPENYVHPRLLELIVDLLKNASEKSQILVTTHSPYFVDLLQPEDLYIVEKQEGQTKIKKAEDKKGIKETLKVLGLGEMWYSGSLGGVP
ncbi:MAG: AAA family ATPase [candidate division WOR-3 bacterium]